MTRLCPCHRHGYYPDIYLRCGGGLCGHPCNLDARDHEPCEELSLWSAESHSCGCLPPQAAQHETIALLTHFLEGN